ncbi:MAG: hypothetical protein HY252_13195 [Sphingobacteriales bacterium]|nr:hypothetical protein [Sphingobacteriales bacterium]
MKKITPFLCFVIILASCKQEKVVIADSAFTDSLIANYTLPAAIKANEDELQFWLSRIKPQTPDIVNDARYASTLAARFTLLGDITDIKKSDSVLKRLDAAFSHKEASPNVSLLANAIRQHRFKEAETYLEKARTIGIKKYEVFSLGFDVDFELGRYDQAQAELRVIRSSDDYGYFFRKSKWEHFKGNMDSAIAAMYKATELARSNDWLRLAALSNEADLCIHNGELEKAYELYQQSVKINAADYHSITAIGWIALVHDKNDSLAEKIFQFVHSKIKSPDPLFKLYQMAQGKKDTVLEKRYATEFANQANDSLYGNMYNKYLIEIYTGILKDPAKAEAIAKKEIEGRSTPQTYAWYAYSLLTNNKKEEAYKVYEQFVSGKPLEGLELYWMGKLMQTFNKGYNAMEFFKAAHKNRYDLSPAMADDLENELKE